MNVNKLKKERISLFKNAITGKEKIHRIPYYSHACCWITSDAGYKLSESCRDYEMSMDASMHMLKTYKIDGYASLMGICNQRILDSLGVERFIYNDEMGGYSLKDHERMKADEYDALIENPEKFLWSTLVPRFCPKMNGPDAYDNFKNFVAENNRYGAHVAKVSQIACDQYGVPVNRAPDGLVYHMAWEDLFAYLRGIKGFSYDMRKNPDKVEAAIRVLSDLYNKQAIERFESGTSGTNPDYYYDAAMGFLAHTVMSPKQFERFIWPEIQRYAELLDQKDKIGLLKFEGDSKRFWYLLRTLPEKRFAILSEMDDIYELKEALPNMTVMGGMPLDLLGYGMPDECVAYAKKLIDEIGRDGRFIFSEQKMLTFKNDCKSDNLIAVSEFVSQYEI